jgi:hypothetical protein
VYCINEKRERESEERKSSEYIGVRKREQNELREEKKKNERLFFLLTKRERKMSGLAIRQM